MPIKVQYSKDGIGVTLYHEGIVTGEELLNSLYEVFNDKRYLNLKYWIGDRQNCTKFLPDTECIKKIIEINKKESLRNPGIFLALISPKDIEFGMSRMFQILSDETSFIVGVFRDSKSAEEWLKDKIKDA